jgi:CRISPR-associated exonuclease Cas4
MDLTATLLNYFLICPRKTYLHAHHIRMEHTSDAVYEGKLIGEYSYGERAERNRELAFTLPDTPRRGAIHVKIDYFDPATRTVYETKKSDKMDTAHRAQLLFYLWTLEQYGFSDLRGVLEYPRLRLRETLTLTEADRAAIERQLADMTLLLESDQCPPVLNKPFCRKCAYCDYCYSDL